MEQGLWHMEGSGPVGATGYREAASRGWLEGGAFSPSIELHTRSLLTCVLSVRGRSVGWTHKDTKDALGARWFAGVRAGWKQGDIGAMTATIVFDFPCRVRWLKPQHRHRDREVTSKRAWCYASVCSEQPGRGRG